MGLDLKIERPLFISFFILLVAGCRQSGETFAFPDEKIARVMADLYIAEAATTGLSGYQKDSLTHVYYGQVMQMHNITEEQYEKELRLRAPDVDRMAALIEQAQMLLESPKKAEGQPKD